MVLYNLIKDEVKIFFVELIYVLVHTIISMDFTQNSYTTTFGKLKNSDHPKLFLEDLINIIIIKILEIIEDSLKEPLMNINHLV